MIPPQASDIDWVSREYLSPEQKALIPDQCCGMYVDPPMPDIDGEPGSVNLSADNLDKLDSSKITLQGDIEIRQNDLQLQADFGTYDYDTEGATLQGNIRIRRPGMLVTGTDASIENGGDRSQINNASYVLHDENIRGSAEVIVYTDADGIVTIENGLYTRCEPGNNSWIMEAKTIVLNQDSGRGVARNLKLRLGNVPILYLPVISFPINDERASGLLAPNIGSTRDGGLELSAPYYLNLAPNYDATVTPRLMSERGVMLGLEGRHLGRRSQNILQMNYLSDDDQYDPAELSIPGSNSPPAPDRWLISLDHFSNFNSRWSANVDYSAVSDRDYFQDFGDNGLYTSAQSYLFRSGNVRYQNDNWRFQVTAQGYQIIDPAVPESRQPYDQLPKINLDGSFRNELGVEYGLRTEYVYFDRNLNMANLNSTTSNTGAVVNGQRLTIEPEISFPWSIPGAFITPKAKYKYASYQLDDTADVFADNPSRGTFMASLDSGLIFERGLDFGSGEMVQTLEPRLFYLYNEYEDQSDIPVFDSSAMAFSFNHLFRENRFSGKDRVADANQLTLAVTTRLINGLGQEKASFSIGQIRFFEDHKVIIDNLPGTAAGRSSGSAIVSELSYQLNENWRLNYYLEWNTSKDTLDVGDFQFRYQSDMNHILNFSYHFRNVPDPFATSRLDRRTKQTDISAVWPLASNWGLIGRWNYDHANSRSLETIAGVEYNNCCYSIRVIARQWIESNNRFFDQVDRNTGIFLEFELKGFGNILGGNVRGNLNNKINGYRESNYAR